MVTRGRRRVGALASLALFIALPLCAQTRADREIVLATTTSVRDAGLLEGILPAFERQSGYRVKVIAVGSGKAMALGRQGEADILVLHAPEEELEFVQGGYATSREALMKNEFVLVGGENDPAGVRGLGAVAALQAIAAEEALFVSRADLSGTHVKERGLWQLAGVARARPWYRESGQGMSATLQIANQLGAYTLTDIGTLLSHKSRLDLEILVDGDTLLANPYHVLVASPARFEWLNAEGARVLRDYLLSEETQRAIGDYGQEESGRSLFVPAAYHF
jgi:tungstate transport system substrate-binding protein